MNRFVTGLVVFFGLLGCVATPQTSGGPVVLPLTLEHGLLFLDVEFPGRGPVLALLDTGANASAIDPRLANHLAVTETSQIVGTTGTLECEIVVLEGLHLGTLGLPALRATRRPLSGLLAPEGRTVDMILGSDALSCLVVTIDFASSQLEITEESLDDFGKGVRMILDDGIPAIEGQIGGIAVWLRIDTGASLFETNDVYINIPERTWNALRGRHRGITPSTYFKGTGANGQVVDLAVAPVPNARVGPLALENAFVIVQPEAGYFANPDAKGFVSNNYLRHLNRVTLDYKTGRLRGDI